jgi:DNA invertase Pin-like site-specific DNA recombinase
MSELWNLTTHGFIPANLSCESGVEMATFGYARVSTRDQDLAAQVSELMTAGCAKVFREKGSGAKTDRPELAKVLRVIQPGDVVIVTRLDRLARSCDANVRSE